MESDTDESDKARSEEGLDNEDPELEKLESKVDKCTLDPATKKSGTESSKSAKGERETRKKKSLLHRRPTREVRKKW